MKSVFQILVAIAIALCVALPATAAPKHEKTSTITVQEFKATIDCEGCVKKVMNTLPYKKGVKDVKVDLQERMITVKYDTSKSSAKDIIEALDNVDIDASVCIGDKLCESQQPNKCCSSVDRKY